MKFMDNDTIALAALGVICICGVFLHMENLCAAAVGAIGGYIGSRVATDGR